jgi:hypothetical protein
MYLHPCRMRGSQLLDGHEYVVIRHLPDKSPPHQKASYSTHSMAGCCHAQQVGYIIIAELDGDSLNMQAGTAHSPPPCSSVMHRVCRMCAMGLVSLYGIFNNCS